MVASELQQALSALDYLDELEKLSRKPPAEIAEHKGFRLDEHRIVGLPGIETNLIDGEAELWLQVRRLHPNRPPTPNEPLSRWVLPSNSPDNPPELEKELVIHESEIWPEATARLEDNEKRDDGLVYLSLADCPEIEESFNRYVQGEWSSWAEVEIPRRKTIEIYDRLFALYQEIETSGSENPLEIVWGIGVSQWKLPKQRIQYPIITKTVEIDLDSHTMSMNIRPTAVEPKVELGIYTALDNPGAQVTEDFAKRILDTATESLSPFYPTTFDSILRSAVANLDANGSYRPEASTNTDDRSLPSITTDLVVTDTWSVFSRPRSTNALAEDIRRLRANVEESEGVVGAAAVVLSGPSDEEPQRKTILYRGVSFSGSFQSMSDTYSTLSMTPRDDRESFGELYFPKPFNEEQVKIVERLSQSDGVVVQGPPGTGKTHTIANIICHYLALGKRVLVTSKGEQALHVLRNQIPAPLRPLVISLLTNEREGLKQLEQSVNQIASEVADRREDTLSREIETLQGKLDALYTRLGLIDEEIGDFAGKQSKTVPHLPEVYPNDLAHTVLQDAEMFQWFPDELDGTESFDPKFTVADIDSLRGARKTVGKDLCEVQSKLPAPDGFPVPEDMVRIHQSLLNLKAISEKIHTDATIPMLARIDLDTIKSVEQIHRESKDLFSLLSVIQKNPWLRSVREIYASTIESGLADDPPERTVEKLLDQFVTDVRTAESVRQALVGALIEGDELLAQSSELEEAIRRAASGKSPFGWFADKRVKKAFSEIRLNGTRPPDRESWSTVVDHLDLLNTTKQLTARWRSLSTEINAPTITANDEGALKKLRKIADAITRIRSLDDTYGDPYLARTRTILPSGINHERITHDLNELKKLIKVLAVHLKTNSLKAAEIEKANILKHLSSCSGPTVESIIQFVKEELGSSSKPGGAILDQWRGHLQRLRELASMSGDFKEISRVTGLIAQSGATKWATLLKTQLSADTDSLLPGNWLEAWIWARSNGYLKSIDRRGDLKKLGKERVKIEADISSANLRLVELLTWLKLKQGLSRSISAALQSYMAAIRRLGKGTGVRANRFRRDARDAMKKANRAVPCWVMPHWRVSETLPGELGSFDLVIIDEASQSDMLALPSILRGKKLLVVGDDKQVSPSDVGIKESDIALLRHKHLRALPYGQHLLPGSSVYDLARTVFASDAVVLREHFRCVESIIQFSNKEFYNNQIRPLRIPKASERIDPPLVEVFVPGGRREGKRKLNRLEAEAIVDEVKNIVETPSFESRTIGVVSLLGHEQSEYIRDRLITTIGEDKILQHDIRCGDAMTFQGKEADIVMLSMVADSNSIRTLTGRTYEQRINVAASRARDRLYVFHSFNRDQLNESDLRAKLLDHLSSPMMQPAVETESLRNRCESDFERSVFDELVDRGYRVTPQVPVGQYRIDMVVEGAEDRRLAIELDGDQYHTPDRWHDDMMRQRVLERMGWKFWRCWGSSYTLNKDDCIADLVETLNEKGIDPIGQENAHSESAAEFRIYPPRTADEEAFAQDTLISEDFTQDPTDSDTHNPDMDEAILISDGGDSISAAHLSNQSLKLKEAPHHLEESDAAQESTAADDALPASPEVPSGDNVSAVDLGQPLQSDIFGHQTIISSPPDSGYKWIEVDGPVDVGHKVTFFDNLQMDSVTVIIGDSEYAAIANKENINLESPRSPLGLALRSAMKYEQVEAEYASGHRNLDIENIEALSQ